MAKFVRPHKGLVLTSRLRRKTFSPVVEDCRWPGEEKTRGGVGFMLLTCGRRPLLETMLLGRLLSRLVQCSEEDAEGGLQQIRKSNSLRAE